MPVSHSRFLIQQSSYLSGYNQLSHCPTNMIPVSWNHSRALQSLAAADTSPVPKAMRSLSLHFLQPTIGRSVQCGCVVCASGPAAKTPKNMMVTLSHFTVLDMRYHATELPDTMTSHHCVNQINTCYLFLTLARFSVSLSLKFFL